MIEIVVNVNGKRKNKNLVMLNNFGAAIGDGTGTVLRYGPGIY
jgi:hypothetical protein